MASIIKILSPEVTLSSVTGNSVFNGTVIRLVNVVNQHHHITQAYANGVTKFTFTICMDSDMVIEKDKTDLLFVDAGSDVFANWIAYKN